ncbi:hypothetical protein BU064_03510 [Staphylococcus succinus]|nr:hypothetical protein BU064_03510 [Staphylococcus succinus]RIM48168.1 hypothetical protein BUY22_02275 [Staphylococcus cohnii]
MPDIFGLLNYYVQTFISLFSNIHLSIITIIITAIIFIILHNLRHLPIVRNISVYVSFFPVLIHELGHAFAAQIFNGQVDDIHMVLSPKKQQETGKQGYAITKARSRFTFIIIAFMGYVSAPLMFFLGCYLITHNLSFIFVALCLLFVLFYLVKTKQKWIPIILLSIVIYSGYSVIMNSNNDPNLIIDSVYNILLGLLLGETIQSIVITTKVTFSHTKSEWDGSAMHNLTHIPAIFWWFIWTIISIFCVYNSYELFFN